MIWLSLKMCHQNWFPTPRQVYLKKIILLLDSSHIPIEPLAFTESCSVIKEKRGPQVNTKLMRPLTARHAIDATSSRQLILKYLHDIFSSFGMSYAWSNATDLLAICDIMLLLGCQFLLALHPVSWSKAGPKCFFSGDLVLGPSLQELFGMMFLLVFIS